MDRKAIDADACQFIESRALGTRAAQSSQALIAAVINGAGCLTLIAYQSVEISGSTASGPQQQMGSAWAGSPACQDQPSRFTNGNDVRRLLAGVDIGHRPG
jgi:hypothetical protein